MPGADMLKDVRAALEREPRVNLHRSHIDVQLADGAAVLEGEVASIEEKRMAAACARAAAGAMPVADRLRVRPIADVEDGTIRDAVCRHLMEDRVFLRTAISCRVAGDNEAVSRRPPEADGELDVSVAGGVVMLNGRVRSLAHKRLASVLAWWAPGCRNVIDEIDVEPREQDSDDELREAVAVVLDKDPIIHSDQITAQVRDRRVVLRGLVATKEEKWAAETDVWYVDGVRDVVNELEVYRGPTGREPMPADPPGVE